MKPSIPKYFSSYISLIGIFFLLYAPANAQFFQLGSGLTVTDVSSDGTVAVGDNGAENFMWTETDGVTLIGGVSPQGFGGQAGVSGDGSIISATRINPNNNLGELSSYDVGTMTWTSHGSLGSSSGNSASSAWGISTDGSTIVGLGWVNAGSAHAIQWTAGGGIVDLGSTVSGRSTRANAANSDGTIIGGWQDSASGFRQGAIWTNGVQALITHPNSDPATEVATLSSDGVWAGGGQGFSNNFQAWIWSQATGIIDIGPAPVGGWRGAISGLSADGGVAVGFYRPFPAPAIQGRGIIYTAANGMEDLTDVATDQGIDLQGAILALPLGISDDGSTIVGLTNSGNGFVLRLSAGVPSNNDCANAIAVACDDVVTGSTVNATDSGGEAAPDVFYSFSGDGNMWEVTLSLCDGSTDYDSYLRVFSDCTLAEEIASNDDECGSQSELMFVSEGTNTYYIMVEGAGNASGNYSLEVSCVEILGVDDTAFQNLNYYPNPVKDELFISNSEEITKILIQSISGQVVIQKSPNSLNTSVDTGQLSSGMYLVTVEAGTSQKTFKLVK